MMNDSGTVPKSVPEARRWRQHPTVRFLAATALLFGLYYGYGYATAPSRLTPALKAHLATNTGRVDLLVTSKFPPEEFHIRIYQNLGSMRGVRGSTAELVSVTPSALRTLSQYYWVKKIDLKPAKKKNQAARPCLPLGEQLFVCGKS